MSKQILNAIISYLLDAMVTSDEIPLTPSLPDDIQEDLRFAAELRKTDFSQESRIRQKLRDQLQYQSALQANASRIHKVTDSPGKKAGRNSGAAFLSVGLGTAAVVMAALLIFFRHQKPAPVTGEDMPVVPQETAVIETPQVS